MSNVVWLAAHGSPPLDGAAIRAWADAAEATLPLLLGGRTRTAAIRSHVTLVAWWDEASPPPGWPQVERSADGSALAVSDGFPIGAELLGVGRPPSPFAIARALREDPARIDRLLPPYAVASLDGDGLTIAIDALGYAKVFHAVAAGASVWSSSASLASLFAFGRLERSDIGWVSLLSHDRFLADTTPLGGVRLEAPRTLIHAPDRPDTPQIVRSDHLAVLHGDGRPVSEVAAGVDAALSAVHESMAWLGMDEVTVTLSGGRDSRVIAATSLARGRVAELFTSVPPELDLEIAQQLVDRLDTPIPWTRRDKGEQTRQRDADALAAGRSTDEIWSNMTGFQSVGDGDGDVTLQVTPSRPLEPFGRPWLWGQGGEFGRAFYYDAASAADPATRTTGFWDTLRRGPSLVREPAREAVLPGLVEAIVAPMEAAGILGLQQLDAFYVFQRIRRLKNRIGTTSGVRPHFAIDHIRATAGLTAPERVTTRHYEAVVARNLPAWAGIPYSHERKADDPGAATAASHAFAFWDSPFVAEVAAQLVDRLRDDPLVDLDAARRIVEPAERTGPIAVRHMRTFDRLLNHVSYGAYLEAANRAFHDAGGRSAVGHGGRIDAIELPRARTAARPSAAPPPLARRVARRLARLTRRS